MIGGNEMLAAIFDPFDRAAKAKGSRAHQNVFRIKFPADAEAAADVTLVKLYGSGLAPEHPGDLVAIPMRHLGGAMQFEHVACGVIAGDRAARFKRHAGMPPD